METKEDALVLGGGFAGLEAAIRLRKAGVDVTLVSERPYLFMYPTSIWVATGERSFESVCLDLTKVALRHGFKYVEGHVEAISAARRVVTVSGREMTASLLFVAIGGRPLTPGGIEHTFGMSGAPEGILRLKEGLEKLLERGNGRIAMGFGGNPADPSAVRGGPVFEMMFNVDHMLRKRGVRDKFELAFFAPMASPGEKMGKKAVEAIQQMFGRLDISMHFGKKIRGFEAGGTVRFVDDTVLASDLTVFVPAHSGHPVVRSSDLPLTESGFVRIDSGCAVPGFPGVYAIGDAAAMEGPPWKAKQGHMAEIMAQVAAKNGVAEVRGLPERESYLPHVSIICLMDMGNGAALVKRTEKAEKLTALPVVGHWMKKGWGAYFKASKMRRVPRLPGM